ncbi:P-loop containing nucleoside triphosphate hydrolase protein [Xylaria sp. FL0064]|nr:P-loop containing nucleoside triphosphate hydrolase protein [Xylaria sp. FL0064]
MSDSESDEKRESMTLSEEERRYFRALLSWEPNNFHTLTRRRTLSPERPLAGRFRILILGAKGCGKTAILTRFCKGIFAGEGQPANPEYERGCQRKIEIKDQTYVVDALELAPSQLSEGHYLRHAVAITEAAVLTYDVRSRDSFVLAQELYQRIQEALVVDERQYYSLILAGNKADGDEESRGDNCRMVTEGEGYELACHFGGGRTRCAFRETSARTGENVDTLFMLLGTELLKLRQLAQQCREQPDDIPEVAIEESNGYGLNKTPRKVPRWRVWSLVRRAFGSAARKTAITDSRVCLTSQEV